MEMSPSWGAANCAATQEFPRNVWDLKVHHHIQKNPPLVPNLSQTDPVHTTPLYLSISHLCLGHPIGIPLCPHSCYMPCPSHPPWLDHSNYTWWRSSLCSFLESPITSPLFGPNILFSNLFPNTLSLCSSLNVTDQVSCPYKTTGKICVRFLNTVFNGKLTSFFPNTLFRILIRPLLPGELSSVLFEHLWYSNFKWYTQNSHLLLFTNTVQRSPLFFLENCDTNIAISSAYAQSACTVTLQRSWDKGVSELVCSPNPKLIHMKCSQLALTC
jgi:hypothetical protein